MTNSRLRSLTAIAAFAVMVLCVCSVGKACEDTNGALGDWNDEAVSVVNQTGFSGYRLNTGDPNSVPRMTMFEGHEQKEFPTLTSKLGR